MGPSDKARRSRARLPHFFMQHGMAAAQETLPGMLWHHQVCLSRPLADLNLGLGCCPGGSGETYLLGPCRLQASLRGLCQKHKVPLTLSQRNTAVSTSTGIWTMYDGARLLMRPWDPQATAQPVTHQRLSLGHLSPEDPLTWFMATPPLPARVRPHLLFRNMVLHWNASSSWP